MADDIKELGRLLDDSLELMKIFENKFEKDPLESFEYVKKIKGNFGKIKKLNRKDSIFDKGKVTDQFLKSLKEFNQKTEAYRKKENSLYRGILSKDTVMQMLTGLEKRYDKLTNKKNS